MKPSYLQNWVLGLSAIVASVSLVSTDVHAARGGESGGGEPGAIEFVSMGHKFINYLDSHPQSEFSKQDAEYILSQIESRLNSDRAKQFLVFTNDEVSCELASGAVSKMACSDRDGVRIHRASWMAASATQKLTVVILELLKLMEKDNRYSTAKRLIADSKVILALPDGIPSVQTKASRKTGFVHQRAMTLTFTRDIDVTPGNDLLQFFDGVMEQAAVAKTEMTDQAFEKKFGERAVVREGHQIRYRSCFIWLAHARGGVLRKGRSFRAILGLTETDGRSLTGTFDGLGYFACSNVQTRKSFALYEAANPSLGSSTLTMTLDNIQPYFKGSAQFSLDRVAPVSNSREF